MIFDTISVKVRWEQWCRWNCDLRVINDDDRHFLLYWKHRHDAENHVSICALRHWGVAAKWPQGNRREKNPVRISKEEAPTPLSVVGPLFISSLLFHLSRTLLDAWRFILFRSVYSSFHNRLDLIREPAFYWVFYFPQFILVCFIICRNEKVLFVPSSID